MSVSGQGNPVHAGASARLRAHIGANVVGYVALFFALGLGTAWANHENIFSDDIVNGEVRTADIDGSAVTSNKVQNGTLTDDDLGANSVEALEIAPTAFGGDIRDVVIPGTGRRYQIPDGAIQTGEIEDGQVQGVDIANGTVTNSDLANSARPPGFSVAAGSTGLICNGGCSEGELALPAGSYAIFAKITAYQQDLDEDLLHVECNLVAGSDTDQAFARTLGDTGGDPGSTAAVTLSTQVIHDFASAGSASLNCRDFDVGDVNGGNMHIAAIRLGATTP